MFVCFLSPSERLDQIGFWGKSRVLRLDYSRVSHKQIKILNNNYKKCTKCHDSISVAKHFKIELCQQLRGHIIGIPIFRIKVSVMEWSRNMDLETGIPISISRTYSRIVPFGKMEKFPECVPETGKIPEHVMETGTRSVNLTNFCITFRKPENFRNTSQKSEKFPETGKKLQTVLDTVRAWLWILVALGWNRFV